MRRFRAARSGVSDGDGVIRAGNGSVEAALEEGITEAIVVDVDGDQMVIVRRRDWTPEEAMAYAITDNKLTDLSEFDYRTIADQLPVLEEAGIDLLDLGWEAYELHPLQNADWSPPPARPGGLTVDTSHVTSPVRVTLDQRRKFDRAVEEMRAEDGHGSMTEGEVLEALSLAFLGETRA